MDSNDTAYESTKFTQKEVLILIQKMNQRDKKWIELKTANWSGLDLRGANLKNARLDFANLSNCNFQFADLENANLRFADLRNSDFSNAKLVSADLSEANCEGTKFDGATGLGVRFRKKWNLPLEEEEKKSKSSGLLSSMTKKSENGEKQERTESNTDIRVSTASKEKDSKDKEREREKEKEKEREKDKKDKKERSSSKSKSSSIKKDKEERTSDEESTSKVQTPQTSSPAMGVSSSNNNNNEDSPNFLTEEQVKIEWEKADKDKSGTLSFKEIMKLLDKLNIKPKEKEMKKKFKDVDADASGELDYEEFKVFLERLRVRPEIEEIFDKITAGKKTHITAEEFASWVAKEQGEKIDLEAAKRIIAECEKKNHGKDSDVLYSTGFSGYLSSGKHNNVFAPSHDHVYQDMNQPFTHYWIASSHNTYLLEDQLKGASSVEAYINAFNKGCKCVELDCWDGEDKANPIIYHGHTLTSKITFREVVETVRDYGFVVSDYPVILSLEVHCGIEGQIAMAAIVKEILGPASMLPPQPDSEGHMPPPEKLKRKVLLKGKMVSQKGEPEPDEDSDDEEDSADSSPKQSKDKKKEKEKKKPAGTAKELSDVIHLKSTHFKDFETSKTASKHWHICSFSEAKVDKLVKKGPQEFIEFNLRQLSRIYPKGVRFDSSNYDPSPSWNCGAQVVALNYQTGSDPMWINDGKFMDNGRSGYLLKPKFLREDKISFNPDGKLSVQKTLIVTVVSGWQLPKVEGKEAKEKGEVIDPYVKLALFGVAGDRKSFKTKVVKNNGFNPMWNSEFKFPLAVPELAILLLTVSDSDMVSSDDFIAQYSINATDVREGYRYVPLRDRKGKFYEKASLLVQFKWQ